MKVSYSQLTELTGKDYKTIRKRFEAVALESVSKSPGKATLWDSEAALKAIYYSPTAGAPGGLDLNSERAREAKERADRLELENAKRRGELMEVEGLSRVFSELLMNFKNKITALPSKLAALADDNDERRRIFIEAKVLTDQALTDLATGMNRCSDQGKNKNG